MTRTRLLPLLLLALPLAARAQLQAGGNLQSSANLQAGLDTATPLAAQTFGYADWLQLGQPGTCPSGTQLTGAIAQAGTVGVSSPSWGLSGSGTTQVCDASQNTLGATLWSAGTQYLPSVTTGSWKLPSNVTLTTLNFPIPAGNLFVDVAGYWTSGIPNDSSGDHDSYVPEATGTDSPYCAIQPFAPPASGQAYVRIETGQTVTHSDSFSVPTTGKINVTLNHTYWIHAQCDGAQTTGLVTTSTGALGSCTANCMQWTSTTYGSLACPFNGYWTTADARVTVGGTGVTVSSIQTGCVATLSTTPPSIGTGIAVVGPGSAQVAIFDPSSSFAQVGLITFGMPYIQSGQGMTTILMLNNESGSSSSSDASHFEDTNVSIFHRPFPIVPSTLATNFPYAIPMQVPQPHTCASAATCADTNVTPVHLGSLLVLAVTSSSTTTTFSTPTSTGAGCSSTTWTFVPGSKVAANATQTSAWTGIASGTGPCTPSTNTSPNAAMTTIFGEFKSASGAVDTSPTVAATCASCTAITLTGAAGTAVANEIAFVWDRNTGGTFGTEAPGCAQYHNSGGSTSGPVLCPVPSSGTTFVYSGAWQNSATDYGAGMIFIEP